MESTRSIDKQGKGGLTKKPLFEFGPQKVNRPFRPSPKPTQNANSTVNQASEKGK